MSLKDLRTKSASAIPDIVPKPVGQRKPVTAPGQLMAFQGEMMVAEDRIKALEAKVKDLETSAILVSAISPNPWQPRRVFDEEELRKLAGSIAEVGLIQPIIVRRVESVSNTDTLSDTSSSVSITDTRYQIIAGERRLRAHALIGLSTIKAIVIDATDEAMAALALAENIDRQDLTDYEIALAIRNAEAAFPNRKSLAACLGINRTELYQYLAFFQLPDFVLTDLEREPGLLGRNAAEAIASVIRKRGDDAGRALGQIWKKAKSGELEQGRIAVLIEATLNRGARPVRTERDIRKLFVGKEQAGSITRDAGSLTIKLRTAALREEQETRLREFVEKLLKG